MQILSLDEQQKQVVFWGRECFGAVHMGDLRVRALRLLEEALEFAQAVAVDPAQCLKLTEYVYSRPVGDPLRELGGVGVTWVAAAEAAGYRASELLEAEIQRVTSKPREHFSARNQAKCDAGFGIR